MYFYDPLLQTSLIASNYGVQYIYIYIYANQMRINRNRLVHKESF